MTEWKLHCYDGTGLTLPTPLAWRLDYGLGSPCDSFWIRFLWTAGEEERLAAGTRMTVTHQGERVFTGVVDECQCRWGEDGCTAEISGRGMQALLLDNQAEAADFAWATQEEILGRYVAPYGIVLARPAALPPVWGFSVASGSSCWKVLYQFARAYAGVTPRFDRQGRLLLSPWAEEAPKELAEAGPVLETVLRHRRYGVLSQVTVKDVSGWIRETQVNQSFLEQGGRCSRVMLMPRDTGHQARRYRAQFQLDRSAARMEQVEVTLAAAFPAWPGELVRLNRAPAWRSRKLFRVQESRVLWDGEGLRTILVLGDPEAVL